MSYERRNEILLLKRSVGETTNTRESLQPLLQSHFPGEGESDAVDVSGKAPILEVGWYYSKTTPLNGQHANLLYGLRGHVELFSKTKTA